MASIALTLALSVAGVTAQSGAYTVSDATTTRTYTVTQGKRFACLPSYL